MLNSQTFITTNNVNVSAEDTNLIISFPSIIPERFTNISSPVIEYGGLNLQQLPIEEIVHKDNIVAKITSFKSDDSISQSAISNTLWIINKLNSRFVYKLEQKDIFIESNGTITIEWYKNNDNYVSVEIGDEFISVYWVVNSRKILSRVYGKVGFNELVSVLNGNILLFL